MWAFEDSPSVVLKVAPEGASMPQDAYVLHARVEDLRTSSLFSRSWGWMWRPWLTEVQLM